MGRSAVAACVVLGGMSCGDSTGPNGAYLTAIVNGQPLVASGGVSVGVSDQFPPPEDVYIEGIEAVSGSPTGAARYVDVRILGFHGVGVYVLGSSREVGQSSAAYRHAAAATANPDTNDVTQAANAGSVTITSYDAGTQQGAGTFSFTAQPVDGSPGKVVVTDGKFAGRFVRVPMSP